MSSKQQVSSLLTFRVGPFHLCVDAVEAEAIIETPQIRSVPCTPPAVSGVFTHRGEIAVAVSLMHKFGLPKPESKKHGRLLVARVEDEPKGFWVDEVLDLLRDSDLQWQKLPQLGRRTIFDHAVLTAKATLLHTNFEKLFHAQDAGKEAVLISAAAGVPLPQIGSENNDLTGFDKKPDPGESIDTGCMTRSADSVMETENPHASDTPSTSKNSIDPDAPEVNYADLPGTKRFNSGLSGQISGQQPRQRIHKQNRPSPGPGIRLYSGSGLQPERPKRPGTHEKSFALGADSRFLSSSTNKKGGWGKLTMAATLLLIVIGACSILLWPSNQQKGKPTAVSSLHAAESTYSQVKPMVQLPTPADDKPDRQEIVSELQTTKFPPETDSLSMPTRAERVDKPKPDMLSANQTVQLDDVQRDKIAETPASAESVDPEPSKEAEIIIESVETKVVESDRTAVVSSPAEDVSGKTSNNPNPLKTTSNSAATNFNESSDANAGTKTTRSESTLAPEKSGEEILRIETNDFTLTIERPEIPSTAQPSPKSVPQTTIERLIHIVVKGDTLWDIAKNYLGNPFRYPELAKLSQIKDPHWIYPGDIITIVRKVRTTS